MNLHALRSLRGQLLATASLFVVCIPAAVIVVWQRPRFEQFMLEKYTANYAQFDARLKTLCDAADEGLADSDFAADYTKGNDMAEKRARLRAGIASLEEPQKDMLYQDWMQRRQPPRLRTPASLVAAAPQFFLRRAEQSVVCGNADQRAAALEFLELSHSPEATVRLAKLLHWARARQIPDLPNQINRVLHRLRPDAMDTHSSPTPD